MIRKAVEILWKQDTKKDLWKDPDPADVTKHVGYGTTLY